MPIHHHMLSEPQCQRSGGGYLMLSKRLKDMETQGLLTRATAVSKYAQYRTTAMADELEPMVHALGVWAHRHVDPDVQLKCLDDHLLMWNIRRKIQVDDWFRRKAVIQFILKVSGKPDRSYWLIVKPNGDTDLCMIDPKFEVDLYVSADLKALTSAWMGHSSFAQELEDETIVMTGDVGLSRSLPQWLKRSSFAGDEAGTPKVSASLQPSLPLTGMHS